MSCISSRKYFRILNLNDYISDINDGLYETYIGKHAHLAV